MLTLAVAQERSAVYSYACHVFAVSVFLSRGGGGTYVQVAENTMEQKNGGDLFFF